VVLTGLDDERLAAQALQEGAQDYLIKGQIELPGLLRALRHAVERKVLEEALFEEKERAQVTLNSIGDGVACTDTLGNISFLNVAAEKMTGWPLQEGAGRPMAEVLQIVNASSRETIANPMDTAVKKGLTVHLPSNSLLIARDGTEIPIEDTVAPIHGREGQVTGAVIVFRDVTAAQEMAREMAHSAEHDFLTGLPNRLLLNDRISQAIVSVWMASSTLTIPSDMLSGTSFSNPSRGDS
jgi:PAS domain S-box-containing protein